MVRLTLDRFLNEHGITRYELSKKTGIVFHIIDKYYKNKVVRYDSYVFDKICTALDCSISDIIKLKND